MLLLKYKVSLQQFNIAQLHVQHFHFDDKFGLGQVGLVRLSDVPLHASTAQLGATSWQSNLLSFPNPHSTVFLSIDEFTRQCLPYSHTH